MLCNNIVILPESWYWDIKLDSEGKTKRTQEYCDRFSQGNSLRVCRRAVKALKFPFWVISNQPKI